MELILFISLVVIVAAAFCTAVFAVVCFGVEAMIGGRQ